MLVLSASLHPATEDQKPHIKQLPIELKCYCKQKKSYIFSYNPKELLLCHVLQYQLNVVVFLN